MKVIVVSKIGFGIDDIEVYAYSKGKCRAMVAEEYVYAKEHGGIENEEEVKEYFEDTIEDDEESDVRIIEADMGIYYAVCEVKGE